MTDYTWQQTKTTWTFTMQEIRNIVYEVSAKDLDYPQDSKEAAQAFYDFDVASGCCEREDLLHEELVDIT
tara:strand:- start:1424 stop:1633 length:210 start_codon:yes stop_codon:yes gene_type:complete